MSLEPTPTEMELRVAQAIGEAQGHPSFAVERYLPEARAAIRALREPTQDMAYAACANTPWGVGDGALEIWQAMLDAASPPQDTPS